MSFIALLSGVERNGVAVAYGSVHEYVGPLSSFPHGALVGYGGHIYIYIHLEADLHLTLLPLVAKRGACSGVANETQRDEKTGSVKSQMKGRLIKHWIGEIYYALPYHPCHRHRT